MGCSASRSCIVLKTDARATTSSSIDNPTVSSHSPALAPDKCTARSFQSHFVHHPPLRKGDTYHLVSLTSSTYGSMFMIEPKNPQLSSDRQEESLPSPPAKDIKETMKAGADSTEPVVPESVINTWELMDGLEDDDDGSYSDPNHNDSILPNSSIKDQLDAVQVSAVSWTNSSSSAAKEKALEREYCHEERKKYGWSSNLNPEDRILLYFTSLRGIRKTYEDCCYVRMTLRGFRVAVDERDISMDSSYRKELLSALEGKAVSLPQVFIRGKRVGGAEKIRQLNEAGELSKLLEGFPVREYRVACGNCGDARFVPCPSCNGSRKVFDEKEGRLRRCSECNENGLKRCLRCTS